MYFKIVILVILFIWILKILIIKNEYIGKDINLNILV